MKKIALVVLTASLVGATAFAAFAGPQGFGRQGKPGFQRAAYTSMTAEQKAEFDKARAAFLNATVDIRKKMAEKRVEMRTLMAQPQFDTAKFKALANDMVDLRSQVAKARIQYMGDFAKLAGPGSRGAGFGGPGFRGVGFRGRGSGGADCPGYGPGSRGYGRGQRGGWGGGNCWR